MSRDRKSRQRGTLSVREQELQRRAEKAAARANDLERALARKNEQIAKLQPEAAALRAIVESVKSLVDDARRESERSYGTSKFAAIAVTEIVNLVHPKQ